MGPNVIINELRSQRERIDHAIVELLKKGGAPTLKMRQQANKLMWTRQDLWRKRAQKLRVPKDE
ncbi:MAG: hypothetical protein ABSB67_11445 [Bryobacteraceae bacterium]|jgi:hypothetical protein